jgi:EAL domain-containing protein (putative c-di-GMP-specific phosphodiesterase class I)
MLINEPNANNATTSPAFSMQSIIPFFQSIIDLDDFGVARYECLARLIDQSATTYKPENFMCFIEREAYNSKLTDHMLMQCVHSFEYQNMPWNINITAQECQDLHLLHHLRSALDYVPNFGHIGLELSHTDALSVMDDLPQFISQCRELNVGVFVDNITDVSTGAQQIFKLDFAGFKLAEQAIINASTDTNTFAELQNIITQAHSKKQMVVAEYVEQDTTLPLLRQLEIRFAQGYLLGKPKQTLVALSAH